MNRPILKAIVMTFSVMAICVTLAFKVASVPPKPKPIVMVTLIDTRDFQESIAERAQRFILQRTGEGFSLVSCTSYEDNGSSTSKFLIVMKK